MSEEFKTDPGIDIFDFLAELWASRWAFIGILVAVVAIGLLSLLPRTMVTGTETETEVQATPLIANIEIITSETSDPLQRSDASLLEDCLAYFDPEHTFGLTRTEDVGDFAKTELTRIFSASVDERTGYGTFSIAATGVEPSFFDEIHRELERAAIELVDVTGVRVKRNLKTLGKVVNEYGGGSNQYTDTLAYRWLHFLDDPSLATGSFRLVTFMPFDGNFVTSAPEKPSDDPSLGIVKRIIVSLLVGGVLGTLFVMFRITIDRRRRQASA